MYVLEGLAPVRKRPGMYIGSTGVDGLHHLIWEVIDNSIDEAMSGHAKNIEVRLVGEHVVSVNDDGRGIPVDTHKQTKKSALETVMTMLHAGGKFGGESYKVSGGLHGVGVSVVNALSQSLKAEVCRDGYRYVQEYVRGKPKYKVRKIGKCDQRGTMVTFDPDSEIFAAANGKIPEFDRKRIVDHLRQQAYLTKGVRIDVIDERQQPHAYYTFYFEGGVAAFVSYLIDDQRTIQDEVFYVHREHNGIDVEAALCYTDEIETEELGFANNIHTTDGGMHVTGFRTALTRSINDYTRSNEYLKKEEENLTGDDVREGLTAVISVKLREPQFEGQTKARLGNPEARTAVEAIIGESFKEFLEKHPQDARRIIEKCLLSAKARKAAKAARETVLRKGALEGLTLPGKLADCISKDATQSELFLVEGDSAGGSAKMGRNRNFQAILPLRGKILNVEKARVDKMLASNEIRSLVVALGAGFGNDLDISKVRYHKIVLMCDADSDGNHIRTLLLTFFYRYFVTLIEHGYLYIAQPPLYRIAKGKEVHYAYTESEKEAVIRQLLKLSEEKRATRGETKKSDELAETVEGEKGIMGISIQRYKGLGEMNPGQLWETTMNPEQRVLKHVTIEDAKEADRIFDILMGSEVAPRKRFIQAHARTAQNIDV
ncbi:MAG: DNA gyrase subunit B [Parcubacteria group bacterium RIFCSPLOWO2_01_FULL_48_18]|nr:MAG: DNA gyrase subunit B [Parcubacteria group bacterium RIFCSPLOWO2_01_FULL_48_18]